MEIEKEILKALEEQSNKLSCPVLLEKLYELARRENKEQESAKMKAMSELPIIANMAFHELVIIKGLDLVETIIDKLGMDGSQKTMNIFAKPPHEFGVRMKNGTLCVELVKPTIILRKPYNLRKLLNPPNTLESVISNPKSGLSWISFIIFSGVLYCFLYRISRQKLI